MKKIFNIYGFQKIIIKYLEKHDVWKKIFYFTDGVAQHFKNKYNFSNLMNLSETDVFFSPKKDNEKTANLLKKRSWRKIVNVILLNFRSHLGHKEKLEVI